MTNPKVFINTIINSYSDLFFTQKKIIGIILLISTFLYPNLAISGLIALFFSVAFAKVINLNDAYLKTGFFIYNPLLVGMSIGYLFKISPTVILFIGMASILTFIVTMTLNNIFSKKSLPLLSLPFAIVSTIIYLCSYKYSNLFSILLYRKEYFNSFSSWFPESIECFLKSLGTILFMPNALIGTIFLLLILICSRINFLLAITGFFVGAYIESLLTGSYSIAIKNPYAFNYILVAIALGGVFLIPSIKSYLIALIGVALSVIINDATASFWVMYKIPVFTLPFNFVVLTFLFVLRDINFNKFAFVIKTSPEATLNYYLSSISRFKTNAINIFLPFVGKWTVYQGFDDEWTHKGDWKWALDFVIKDIKGNTFKNLGNDVKDYYSFNKPIFSPANGYIVGVIDNIEDNKIGEVNNTQNWGNYLIIQTLGGIFIEISHFACNSIVVKKGDYIEVGQKLGACGNSGYSPEPHIHIQVQESAHIGSRTLEFNFITYLTNEKNIEYYSQPEKNKEIQSYFTDKRLDKIFSKILETNFKYEVFKDNKKISEFEFTTKMNSLTGEFYFEETSNKRNPSRLYFAKEFGQFYFHDFSGNNDYMKLIFKSLPRIPLFFDQDLTWKDTVPNSIRFSGINKLIVNLISSFYKNLKKQETTFKFISQDEIQAETKNEITNITLDKKNGIKMIAFKDIKIIKKPEDQDP